jgi:hypothetical protein
MDAIRLGEVSIFSMDATQNIGLRNPRKLDPSISRCPEFFWLLAT